MAVLGALGDLVLALSADTARFQSDLGRADRMAKKFGNEVGRALGNVAGMLVALGGSAGLTSLVKGQIDAADQAGKLSQELGIATSTLSSYMVQARLARVSDEQLGVGLGQLAKNQADFVAGTGEARTAFAALGITQEQVNALNGDTAAIFELVAGKLAKVEDGGNKTAIAMKIFGESGKQIIPLINKLDATRKEAEQLNAIIDSDTAASADRFNNNLTRAGIVVQAFGLNIAKAVLPTLEKMSERLVQSAKDAESMGRAGEIADTGLRLLATGGTIIATLFKSAGERIGAVAAALVALASGEFRQAGTIIAESARDTVSDITGAVKSIQDIWTDTANNVSGKAPQTGKKLAAPALVAADATEKAAARMKAAIMSAHNDAMAWAESGIEAQKQLEKEIGETLDRDDADMIVEAPLLEDADGAMRELAASTEKAKKSARDFGFTFNSELEDAILNGGKLSDVLKAIDRDIARMIVRKTITEPLGDAVSGVIGGIDFAGIAGGLLGGGGIETDFTGSFAEGTDYVPRTGLALVHQGEKIIPAAENRAGRNDGGGVNITQHIHIDSRSDQASIQLAMRRAKDDAVSEVRRLQMSRAEARI